MESEELRDGRAWARAKRERSQRGDPFRLEDLIGEVITSLAASHIDEQICGLQVAGGAFGSIPLKSDTRCR